jgi:imidazolonepropionase-like amidohydrolase
LVAVAGSGSCDCGRQSRRCRENLTFVVMTRLVLTNVNLLDGEHAARAGATVAIDGERIDELDTAPRPDDRVVDLRGRTVMPGMATCHFHSTYNNLGSRPAPFGLEDPPAYQAVLAARNLERALRCGFTSVVSAGAPHDIDASMKRAIDDGVIPGPRFMPGSRDVSTTGHANDYVPAYWDLHAWGAIRRCDSPDEFRKAVRDEIKRGAEIIKLFVTGGHGVTAPKHQIEMTREELQAAVDAAHARGRLARAHVANKPAILMAVAAGIDVIDHGDELDTECIDAIVAAGVFLVPSIMLPRALLEQLGPSLGFTAAMRDDLEHMYKVLPEANAAGVKLLLGDDYGALGLPHGVYAAELAAYATDAGIPALDVIRWATQHGAELMGRGDHLGTVEAGKLADLLVVDGDPSTDLAILQEPAHLVAVLKGGELVAGNL